VAISTLQISELGGFVQKKVDELGGFVQKKWMTISHPGLPSNQTHPK
jgi:hypothetical protein